MIGEKFLLRVPFQCKWFRLKVERLPDADNKERWKVEAGNKTLLMTNNRPLFLRKGLKHRAEHPSWQNEGDQVHYTTFEELVVKGIESWLAGKRPL